MPFVARVTETGLPVPSLEVVGNPSHFATHADIEEVIIIGELFTARAGVVDTAELNPGSHGDWHSVNDQSRVPNGEGIKRIRDRTLMPLGLNPTLVPGILNG